MRGWILILIFCQDLTERCLIEDAGIMMTQRRLNLVVSVARAEITSLTDQLEALEKFVLLAEQSSTLQTGQ
jgi:hypothetical protein